MSTTQSPILVINNGRSSLSPNALDRLGVRLAFFTPTSQLTVNDMSRGSLGR